ncbi:PREDICTED: olfactory receptor 52Z1-like [Nanorana parkeri]|uniref:olfactory receptor 52Z1-like n=1 Tax=Nanorana parkeri TaxID=125878 RepID=UPI0008544F48|nr:PREDICTED: olfactory receptor 52Z1-like [Nanorana parkeri]
MENGSTTMKDLQLLGLQEMEGLKYFYCPLLSVIYLCSLMLSILIAFVVSTNRSLHEPMYILICNLVLNGIVGSSSFFPKLVTDLWTSSKTISRDGCLTQSVFIMDCAFFEMMTFSLMAYDRYLAVCHPLHYNVLMTNATVIKVLISFSVALFLLLLVTFLLTIRLPLCGTQIKNIFCDNNSIFILACTDTSVNNIYGTILAIGLLGSMLIIIVFSYVRTYIACLGLSKESRHKVLYTLATHLIIFSVFFLGFFFMFIRHRVGSMNLPVSAHVGLSMPALVVPPLMNPLIFGVRTKALKIKMGHLFKSWIDF